MIHPPNDLTVDMVQPINLLHPWARGLLANWRILPGMQGSSRVMDLTDPGPNGNHGTLTNMDPVTAYKPVTRGYGVDFGGDNSGDHIQLARRLVLPAGEPWTISCWVDIDSLYNFGGLFGHTFSPGEQTRLLVGATSVVLYADDDATLWNLDNAIHLGLHHYAWTRKGIHVVGYRDGVLLKDQVVAAKAMTVFRLATYGVNGAGDDALDGRGFSWAVHNRAFSPDEIQLSYERPDAMLTLRQRVFPEVVVPVTGTVNPFSMGAINLFHGKLAG